MSYLGLDIGTTGTKAAAFNEEGDVIALSYREYPLLSPRPGWQELDPEEVWSAVKSVLSETAAKTKHDPVRSLAVSSQGEACHAVDRNGRCLTNSVVTFDARTASYPSWWKRYKSPADIARITGMPLHGMHSINKIMWFRENHREIYPDTWKYLCFEDFIHLRLGLEPVMSYSLASRTMAFDVRRKIWSDEMLGIADLDPSLLPFPAESGTPSGIIPDRISDELGLPRRIITSAGGHDQTCGALGAGVIDDGQAVMSIGTVTAICPVFNEYIMTGELAGNNLCCYNSCVPEQYASLAFNFTGGNLLKWYRDNFSGQEKQEALLKGQDVYDVILGKIPQGPESIFVLPHFTITGTPYFDTSGRGMIAGLTLNTDRHEIAGALITGIANEMKINIELLEKNGIDVNRINLIGGGSKNPILVQKIADILGMPVSTMKNPEAAALGAAILGTKAAGLEKDVRKTAGVMASCEKVYIPDAEKHNAYQERFAIYRDLYPAMKKINTRIAALEK